jgi:1-acyl-sn-glycerol-3-phosphate acyltransferase
MKPAKRALYSGHCDPGSKAWRWVFSVRAWLCLAAVLLVFTMVAAPFGPRPWTRPLARRCARALLRLSGIALFADGLRRLPAGPHVLVVNHTSFLDALVLIALLPPRPGYAYVTRQEFRSQALLWPLLHCMNTLVLRPAHGSYDANVELMTRRLAGGESLVIFPEGRFRAEPGLLRLHSGAFLAASRAGVPVVVAGLRGARVVLPLGTWMPRPGTVALRIGPILAPLRQHPDPAGMLKRAARIAMLALCGEPGLQSDPATESL